MSTITLPTLINSSSENGYDRIEFSVAAPQNGRDLWILTRNHASAIRVVVNGILLSTFGQFPPETFIPIGRYVVFRIPAQVLKSETVTTVTLLLYSDHKKLTLNQIYIVDQKTASFYNETLNLINTDIYRYFSFLCFFIFVYFMIQFIQIPRETSHLYFALFNLFIALYFFGTGFMWSGLPFAFFYAFFKACLFPSISFVVLFCMAFTRSGNRIIKSILLGIGLVLFGYVLGLDHNTILTYERFRYALIAESIIMIGAFVFIIRQYFKGQRELQPLIFGGILALITGLIDIWSLITSTTTLFWLQGFGIFFFLLSVFMALAQRTTRMHQNLAGYTRAIEVEVDRRTAELNTSNSALLRASKAKSAFLAHMSHEIRTPLNGIMGFTQLIEQGSHEQSTRYYSGLILKESDHLMQLISHILDFSRIEQGKLVLDKLPFSPLETITGVIESFALTAKEKGLQFEFLISGDIPDTIQGDQLRFQQILVNIVGNAIKFTERGYVRIEARGARIVESTKVRIEIAVSDSGIGIPEDKIGTIFKSFEQADASISRKFGGTGLGISIARDLVRLMGGEMYVKSTYGIGTKVEYHVFLEGSTQKIDPGVYSKTLIPPSSLELDQKFTVLVVDDYPSNIEVLKAFFSKAGIVCREASSGMQALEIVQKHNDINLILMDIHMPGMDGFETTRQLHQLKGVADIPIIALTADAYEETRKQCKALGILDVITKPVLYNTLMECIARFLPGSVSLSTPYNSKSSFSNPDSTKAIDRQMLLNTYFGEEDIIEELLQSFSASAESVMQDIEVAIKQMDYAVISLKSHAIKGAALNVAAHRMAQCATELEEKALEHNTQGIMDYWDLLKEEWKIFLREKQRAVP